MLGIGRPESVNNLTRGVDRDLAKIPTLRNDIRSIESRIAWKTKNRSAPADSRIRIPTGQLFFLASEYHVRLI
jgi:hypothetical protein